MPPLPACPPFIDVIRLADQQFTMGLVSTFPVLVLPCLVFNVSAGDLCFGFSCLCVKHFNNLSSLQPVYVCVCAHAHTLFLSTYACLISTLQLN